MISWYDNVYLAEPEYFDDYENEAVLDACAERTDEALKEDYLPEDFSLDSFKEGLPETYQAFLSIYTEKVYIEEHDAWCEEQGSI